eukprot:CCRYP_009367-RD/>CCRYP_009367-RD protein AED:0.04 eAED:0.04 QI:571/1/1/1/1/1/4/289/600
MTKLITCPNLALLLPMKQVETNLIISTWKSLFQQSKDTERVCVSALFFMPIDYIPEPRAQHKLSSSHTHTHIIISHKVKGLQSPYLGKSLAAVRECQDSLAKRLNQVPLPDLETSLAKVNECAGDMKTSLAKVNDRAGSVAKGVSQSMERLVCGDEHTLQYHAQQQAHIVSPKQEVPLVPTEGIKSPTNAALGKYTLHRLLCGNYHCSDCVSDLAIGAADILFFGYCDCDNSKDIVKTDTIEEFEDIFSYRTDVLSPDTTGMALLSPTTAGDETARTFTFDSVDSTDSRSMEEAPTLNLAKAAVIVENKILAQQSVELTEEEFEHTKNEVGTITNILPVTEDGKKHHWHTPFTPKTPQKHHSSPSKSSQIEATSAAPLRNTNMRQCELLPGSTDNTALDDTAIPDIKRIASDNEKVAIELLVSEILPTESNKPTKKSGRRKSFFRRDKEAQSTKAATTGYRIHAVIEDTKKYDEEAITGRSNATSYSDKPGISSSVSVSTGEGSIPQRKKKNSATSALKSLKPPGSEEKRRATTPADIKSTQGVAVKSSDDKGTSGAGCNYGTALDRGTGGASFQSKESLLTAQTSNGGTIDNQPSLYSF